MSSLEKDLLWQINKNLEEISVKLDRVIHLLTLAQKHDLEEYKVKIIGKSSIRKEIFNICDGTKTVQDIAKMVGKSIPHVSNILSFLAQAGLVISKDVGRKKYYDKVI